jgi:methyltransferase (TIGR00027 family)
MQEGRPSATAQRVAMRRAAHQLLDDPKVFDDPLALRILGDRAVSALRADLSRYDRPPGARAFRAFFAARSRFAEDELARAVEQGVGRYVVLGAGLDTFAYRNPYPPERLRVFEVDHPATQAWKRARLAEAAIPVPDTLRWVPVDFERESLTDGLRNAGFRDGERAFVSWLGVTPYLTREAIATTLAAVVAATAPGSAVVFDYALAPASMSFLQRLAVRRLAARVASVGEPFRSHFAPAELVDFLHGLGFSAARDVDAEELNARYFHGRRDGLRLASLTHFMRTQV